MIVKMKRGWLPPMRRQCSWLCGSFMATSEVQMYVFPHFTVMPTQILVLLSWAMFGGIWAIPV